jgi:UDP-N-acetylglucosamine diphosphorylase/glucosamine-1-phosphate N-acetyltransferase
MNNTNFVLFDDFSRGDLLPFTYTRPVSEIRIGILTIREKWEKYLKVKLSYQTEEYLSIKYPIVKTSVNCFINGKVCPNEYLVEQINALTINTGLKKGNELIAYYGADLKIETALLNSTEIKDVLLIIRFPWDIFSKNDKALRDDFYLITKGRISQKLSPTNTLIGSTSELFIEEGASIEAAILNTKTGPVYIGKDAEIMEGSVVRGPFALCEHSVLKLSTKIYGATTIGPYSKVGGEINNSVVFGYSNKAHDGFLGNSVIGEWCNLGADTNNSNLKNNYAEVKIFNYPQQKMIGTGLQFCGLMFADHSKSGINTMFNTGTVVGVAANIFGGGFPNTHIPSYTWGGIEISEVYQLHKMFETTEIVFSRRGLVFNDTEKGILTMVFEITKQHR